VMKRILVAVDESEHSDRALHYVGNLLNKTPEVEVTLFHVLAPVPHRLYEHGGSEDPAVEQRLGEGLRTEREAWFREQEKRELPVVERGRRVLAETGFPAEHITMTLSREHDVPRAILDEARTGGFDTIVMALHSKASGLRKVLANHAVDPLVHRLSKMTLWVVA
jgi:nucleotide-binding universal stress UspA family protein